MSWKLLVLLILVTLVVVVAVLSLNSRRLDRENRALAEQLLAASEEPAWPRPEVIGDLPSPTARYLERAMPGGIAPATARLEQRGEMLQGGAWRPFTAIQHITAVPAGFVWDARIAFAPLVEARVVDAYVEGEGALRAKLMGTFTVADAQPGPVLDESELMRFLAEGPWLPTVLVPRPGLEWSEVDETSARVTLENGDDVATLTFTFDEAGDAVRVEGERPRGLGGDDVQTGLWVGRFWGYQEVEGVRIPMAGEVAWVTDGELEPYWRGSIERVEFGAASGRGVNAPDVGPPVVLPATHADRSN